MNQFSAAALLFQTLRSSDTFTENALKLASFTRKTEERFSVPETIASILNESDTPRTLERILFSFLDICQADFDLLATARPLRNIRRLVNRGILFPSGLTPQEQEVLTTIMGSTAIRTVDDVVAASRNLATVILQFSQESPVSNEDRIRIATLLSSEAQLLKIRSEWLSDHVDSYNMMAIARLLPLLTVCDEQTGALNDIAKKIAHNEQIGRSILTFEYSLRSDTFEKWVKKAGEEPSLKQFCTLLEMQRTRLVPVKHLIAVATLSRRLHAADTSPLTWISHALSCCTKDGFRMDIGTEATAIRPLLNRYHIEPKGNIVSGSFTAGAYLHWINHDMLTRNVTDESQEPSPRELVMRCIGNDALLLRLLENPKVQTTPGLIAKIAYSSRSLAVLQKIATTRELHSGHSNSGVPVALLKNPSHIPFSQLRQFINTRNVSLVELKELLHNPFGIRREIFSEIKTYITRRYG